MRRERLSGALVIAMCGYKQRLDTATGSAWWFVENSVEYLRTQLFARAADDWRAEGWLAQPGWIRALGHEGGLFLTFGRRT